MPLTSTYMTGFCNTGAHEGTRPKSPSGIARPVCLMWEQCSCDCHVQITRMFEMVGQERTPQDNPEYVTPKRTFWLPSDEPEYLPMPEPAPEVTDEGMVIAERAVETTEAGRTQRGGLEYWVQRECLAWVVDKDPTYCTVKYLSEEISRVEKITPPSQGAIAAVFDRWVKYGYAVIEVKPRRFLKLTEQGEKMGLDWCRANWRSNQKR